MGGSTSQKLRQIYEHAVEYSCQYYIPMLLQYFIYSAKQVSDTYPIWFECVCDTPRGVSYYFIHFDRPIRSPIRLDTSQYSYNSIWTQIGCVSGLFKTTEQQLLDCYME
jgi:hypothetical protein